MGGTFRIYDVLGIDVQGRISIDISKTGNRVTRNTWPSVWEHYDVEALCREDIKHWASVFHRCLELHIWSGFPVFTYHRYG